MNNGNNDWVFLNDRLVPPDQAQVSAYDAGLLHGVGLFETLRSYAGKTFRLDDHLDRLFHSAQTLHLALSHSPAQITQALRDLLHARQLADARIRITVTRGSILPSAPDQQTPSTLLITASPLTPYPPEYYQKGMMAVISPYKQNPDDPLAGHKTINYFPRLLALQHAQRLCAGEALWFSTANRLAEGCISNVFLVFNDMLLTPQLDTPVLPGVTRKVVLELARELGLPSEERPLLIQDLLAAREVFLTNSIMELMPVCHIERHPVGNEKPGEIYKKLHERYKEKTVQLQKVG